MNLVRDLEQAAPVYCALTEIVCSLSLLLRRLSRSFVRRARLVHSLVQRSELI